jgi:pteridine reductase
MTRRLEQRTALVTGAAARIGRSIALGLADEGCHVIVHYHRSQGEAEQVAAEARQRGVKAIAVWADLSHPADAARRLFDEAATRGMRPDILINNASVFEPGGLLDTDEPLWDRQFAVNLKSPFFLCREFSRRRDNAEGDIINLCDWRGVNHPHGHDAYTLSKAGLVALTRMLARELAPTIRVNGIAPGAILAPAEESADFEQRARESIPLRRTGSPEEIVRGVLYLLEAEFVTGELLWITGGEGLT